MKRELNTAMIRKEVIKDLNLPTSQDHMLQYLVEHGHQTRGDAIGIANLSLFLKKDVKFIARILEKLKTLGVIESDEHLYWVNRTGLRRRIEGSKPPVKAESQKRKKGSTGSKPIVRAPVEELPKEKKTKVKQVPVPEKKPVPSPVPSVDKRVSSKNTPKKEQPELPLKEESLSSPPPPAPESTEQNDPVVTEPEHSEVEKVSVPVLEKPRPTGGSVSVDLYHIHCDCGKSYPFQVGNAFKVTIVCTCGCRFIAKSQFS